MIKTDRQFMFGVVGAGKLGTTLVKELYIQERLEWVIAKSKSGRDRLEKLDINRYLIIESIENLKSLPNMIIIAVPDSAIHNVSVALADRFGKNLKDKYVVHTSGVLGREILSPCEEQGASIASLHPFQSFYFESDNPLPDIRWGIDSTDEDYPLYASFVQLLYGFPVRLTDKSTKEKALYHAVASAASNYMTSIIQLANKIADSANIDSNQFLPPIAKTTLGNNLRGLTDSKSIPLTGPVSRADAGTIKLHIDAMKDNPEILRPYCFMGLATTEMAHNAGILKDEDYDKIMTIFKEELK